MVICSRSISPALGQRFLKLLLTPHRTNYVVILPEIPDVSPEKNVLMRCSLNHELPTFSQLQEKDCFDATAKLSLDFEVWMQSYTEKIGGSDSEKTFDTLLTPILEELKPLDAAWATTRQLYSIKCADSLRAYRAALKVQNVVNRARFHRFNSPNLHRCIKGLRTDKKVQLDSFQQRLCDKYLLEGRLNGLDLSDTQKESLLFTRQRIEDVKSDFNANVFNAGRSFAQVINDPNELLEAPENFKLSLATDPLNSSPDGPWNVPLNSTQYWPFMRYCSSRPRRLSLWTAYNSRAGFEEPLTNNSVKIEDLRMHRSDEAKLLGYSTYAEMSMQTKMAGSVDTVLKFIQTLKAKFTEKFKAEFDGMNALAEKDRIKSLRVWDVDYYNYMNAKTKFNFDENELSKYFPFGKVFESLLRLTEKWFSLSIEPIRHDSHAWHPDVLCYEVKSSGKIMGRLYVDPYKRAQKKSEVSFNHTRCKIDGADETTVIYLNFNLPAISGNQSSLASFDDLKLIFRLFGKSLQFLMSESPYADVRGSHNVEWDAVELPSIVSQNLLFNPDMLSQLSCHHESGEKLSVDKCRDFTNGMKLAGILPLLRDLYYSEFDMKIHTLTYRQKFWMDISKDLWPQYFPFPLERDDYHLCSFKPVATGKFPAAYYSQRYAEMLACDIGESFTEAGGYTSDKFLPTVGKYGQTILRIGGGQSHADLFRSLRGRDPSPEGIMKFYDVQSD